MDVTTQTTPLEVQDSTASVAEAVQALLDRQAIADLVTLYALTRDDHDIDGLMECFATDGVFIDAGRPVTGHAELREFYLGNMRRHAFGIHIPNSHVVELRSATEASGIVTGHGEFAGASSLTMCAYRYHDRYVKRDGRWAFSYRDHDFIYALPIQDMATMGRDELRLRKAGERTQAEWLPRQI